MSAPVARAAAQAGKVAAKGADSHVLKKGAKRDPELYVQPPVPLEFSPLLGQRALYSLIYESIANISSTTGSSRCHVRSFWSCGILLR
jgi:hypothetical protein